MSQEQKSEIKSSITSYNRIRQKQEELNFDPENIKLTNNNF